jgi:4-amino-4-deoxy-L-arabinose transferase
MYNLVFGIITVGVCVLIYWLSFRYFKKKKYVYALLFIMLGGLFLRVYTGTDLYLHTWDERYHALVAKNMIEEPFKPMLYTDPVLPYDYKEWSGNHIWLHKQPLPLWSMALSMRVFGVNEIALRIPSILLSVLAIWFTYIIAGYFFDKKTALLAAFLHSINGLIIEITAGRVATDHIDLFFLVLTELAVVFLVLYLRKEKFVYVILSGIAIGLAILSKWLPAMIIIPLWIIMLYQRVTFPRLSVIILVLFAMATAVALPWQLYIYSRFPLEAKWESYFNILHVTMVTGNMGGPWYYHFEYALRIWNELIIIPFVWLIYQLFYNKNKKDKYLALFVWIIIPYIFFSCVQTKMQGYLLFTGPALFSITASCFFDLNNLRHQLKYPVILFIVMIVMIVLPIRYCIERVKPFEKRIRKPQWTKDIQELKKNIVPQKTIVFNSDHYIETMFYTSAIAYRVLPDSAQLKKIQKEGYKIIITNK